MASKRNALAELAERMRKYISESAPNWSFREDATKAQRIVAEIAKVSDGEWNDVCNGHPAYFCTAGDMKVQCCIGKCRAIAEEGAKDEGK